MNLLALRADLSSRQTMILNLIGVAIVVLGWHGIAVLIQNPVILPSPVDVLKSFHSLFFKYDLFHNLFFSVKINIFGYFEAIAIALPIGFILGLFPLFRELFVKPIDSFRFLPLTALTGIFIQWFGIESEMKVHFLAFGILVYLLPVVVSRVNEVDQVYVDTLSTLGASKFQIVKHVFIPDVLGKIITDIRVITALSWTYIIVAEVINKSEGGIGALAFTCARQSKIDHVFAILLVIIMIGYLQDRFCVFLDKFLFPYNHE